MRSAIAVLVIDLACGSLLHCSPSPPASGSGVAGVKATHSQTTGKLELVTYDTNKDGKVVAWSHINGARSFSMDSDSDFKGKPDRRTAAIGDCPHWQEKCANGDSPLLQRTGTIFSVDSRPGRWHRRRPRAAAPGQRGRRGCGVPSGPSTFCSPS